MGFFSSVKKVGGGLLGGITGQGGADAAGDAAAQQERFIREGIGALDQSYKNQLSLLQPYLQTGDKALSTYSSLLGLDGAPVDYSAFENLPEYQFALQQGQLGIDRAAAAGGNLFAGGRLKEAAAFNSGLASQNFNSYANRLSALANLGPQTAGMLSGYQGNLGQNKANMLASIGDARAGGYLGAANSYSNAASNLLNFAGGFFGGGGSAQGLNAQVNPSAGFMNTRF